MPDAYGNFKGSGWSQKRSDAWERVFGRVVPAGTYEVLTVIFKDGTSWVGVEGALFPAGYTDDDVLLMQRADVEAESARDSRSA